MFIFTSSSVVAANWNTGKGKTLDFTKMQSRSVPRSFPEYSLMLDQECVTSKGSRWFDSILTYVSNDFLWAGNVGRNNTKLYEGKRANRNLFIINVSEASTKYRDKHEWIKYRLKGDDIFTSLQKGVKGRYESGGGYWRECTLKLVHTIEADAYKNRNRPALAQARGLGTLAVTQRGVLSSFYGHGVQKSYQYDFEGAAQKLKVAVAEEQRKAEVKLAIKRAKKEARLAKLQQEAALRLKKKQDDKIAQSQSAQKNAEEQLKQAEVQVVKKKAEEAARLAAVEEARKKAEEEARIAAAEAARKKAEENLRLAEVEAARNAAEQKKRLKEILEAKRKSEEQSKLAKAAELESKNAEEQTKLAASGLDKSPPKIFAEIVQAEGPEAIVEGKISDDVGVKFANIDGETLKLAADGSFTSVVYIPRSGKTLTFTASDDAGKKTEFKLELARGKTSRPLRQKFASLNPVKRKAASNKNAIAMIIGISDYERTSARAAYADEDAKYFYDYATLKLGVPEENVMELINDRADRTELKIATKSWLKKAVSSGQSDVFVFFAGHGMASDDGNNMFLLPYDGAPELLEESAIRRDMLFGDIDATNPRSVTVFLDTCYSGTSRSEEQLVSARPVSIKAKPQLIPKKFTVITAAGNDQTAKPLEEVKHGMFSYFVMRGLEGDADGNTDKKITAGELHKYVKENVDRYSAGSQTPQIQGNADAVLVRFQ